MVVLRRSYRVDEKYSLQQYEGRVVDAFLSDMKSIQKIALQVYLYLYGKGVFCIQRVLTQENLTSILNILLYDKDYFTESEIIEDANRVLKSIKIPSGYGPGGCSGFASGVHVVVWVPVDLSTGPYKDKKVNNLIYDDVKESAARKMDNNNIVKINGFGDLDLSKFKNENVEALNILNQDIPENKLKNLTGYLDIDYRDSIDTIKHEFTHFLDRDNASKVNFYITNTKIAQQKAGDTARANNLDNDTYYETIKEPLNKLLFILYHLWSYTEFNAFTYTYGDNIRRSEKRSKELDKIIKTAYANQARSSYDTLESLIKTVKQYISDLSSYDLNFWSTAKEITRAGSNTKSVQDRYDNMSPSQFKKYFIDTSNKLVEKFKEKTIKNTNIRNIYQKDVATIAREIEKKCSGLTVDKKNKKDLVIKLNFDFFFKKNNQNSPVTVTFTVPYLNTDNRSEYMLCTLSEVHIQAKYINLDRVITTYNFFGKETSNGFSELVLELYGKNRKGLKDKYYMDFAEDLYKALEDLP